MPDIPAPSRERLLQLMRLLENHTLAGGKGPVTSAWVEQCTGWSRETIRKDISCLGAAQASAQAGTVPASEVGTIPGTIPGTVPGTIVGTEAGTRARKPAQAGAIGGNAGYEPAALIPLIKKALGLDRRRKFCVVGLGRLGSAYLNFSQPELREFEMVAGFDTNVNRVEILQADIPLYPAYKMTEVISRLGIEIALLCVPAEVAQAAAEKCAAAGIRGILNFAPAALTLPPEIAVRNMYVTDELRSLSIEMK